MLFRSDELVLDVDAERMPIIGYDNKVTALNVTSTTADADFPITNVANPLTHLKWVGGVNTAGIETITISGLSGTISYLAIVRHNLGTIGASITIGSTTNVAIEALLHFDGADASAVFTDATGKTWTANGDVQIDTAQSKFGGASGLFDGTGDFLTGDGSASFAFGTSAFTIDFWVRLNTIGTLKILYDSRPASAEGFYPTIYIDSSNVIKYFTNGADRITGTTTLATGQWYHVSVTRSGTSTRLFLNGTQEGSTFSDSSVYLNGANRPMIGAAGPDSTGLHNGWIDELRVVNGIAAWTTTFTPEISAYIFGDVITETITNDLPLIFQFTAQTASSFSIQITSATPPEIAVIYLGDLLTLERSVVPDAPHVPVNLGRRTKTVQGRSTNGNYLGSIVLNESRESLAKFMWFDEAWYRVNFDPFVVAAQESPFVFAWNPAEMPEDVGYCWLIEDPMPEFDPVTRRIGVDLKMQGVA